MSHVLITGHNNRLAEIKARLKGWGMTAGELIPVLFHQDEVTVDDCDAVILDLRDDDDLTHDGISVSGADKAAPVLVLISGQASGFPVEGAWAVLANEDEVDARLLQELQGAIAHSRQKRGLGAGTPGGSYLHLLGHELRSPLTAAKCALEALRGELARDPELSDQALATDPAVGQANVKMVDIALRNIQRMHQTVEWSQDLLTHMETLESEEDTISCSTLI